MATLPSSGMSGQVVVRIGSSVAGGTANEYIYIDASGTLAQSTGAQYDGTNSTFTGNVSAGNVTVTTAFDPTTASGGTFAWYQTYLNLVGTDLITNYGAFRRVGIPTIAHGTTIASTAETALYSSAFPIPGLSVAQYRTIKAQWMAVLTTDAATPGTAQVKIKHGATTLVTLTTPTLATSLAAQAVLIEFIETVTLGGAAGTSTCFVRVTIGNNTTGIPQVVMAQADVTGLDWTAAQDLSATWKFSALGVGAGNTITAYNRIVEI